MPKAGRKAEDRLSPAASLKLGSLIAKVCADQQITKLELDDMLGKSARWTSNELSAKQYSERANKSVPAVRHPAALELYAWLLERRRGLTAEQEMHVRHMRSVLSEIKQNRELLKERPSYGRVIPILIDARDIGSFASALGAYLQSRPDPAAFEKNIKRFFNETEPKSGSQTFRDSFAFQYRMTMKIRAIENGYPDAEKITDGWVSAKLGGIEIRLNARSIPMMLAAIEAMACSAPRK